MSASIARGGANSISGMARFDPSDCKRASHLLQYELLRTIQAGGPLTVADFMRNVNTHPKYGYYNTKEVFGRGGDFITAPEISQTFGELIAIWLIHRLQLAGDRAMNRPIHLVELGPGRGTLMHDMLRTMWQIGGMKERIKRCTLIENSPSLQRTQERALLSHFGNAIQFSWLSSVDELAPMREMIPLIVSNEFFDALPVHIFQREQDLDWREVLVDGLDAGESVPFRFVLSNGPTAASRLLRVANRFGDCRVGAMVQLSPLTDHYCTILSDFMRKSGFGIMLTIDYGTIETPGGYTLREVGECDLSVDVDFGRLMEHFGHQHYYHLGPLKQGDFLREMGIGERLATLSKANPSMALELEAGVNRLINPDQMGSKYLAFGAITK